MPRPLWTGSLSFGLVNVPVEMVSAVRDRDVHFHQVKGDTGERIELRRVASADDKRVAWEETAKGWETEDGEMLVLTADELAAAAPEATSTIDIEQFVELHEIDPVYFHRPYWLLPTGKGAGPARAYRLLVDVMATADKVAIGTVVMRSKQYLVALREQDGLLSLTTMHFADEIRDPEDVPAIPRGEDSEPDEEAIEDAVALIGELTDDFVPEDYEDEHRKRLLALIDEKRKTGEVTVPEPEPEPKPQKAPADLVKALEESLQRARSGSKSGV